jgi:phosphatidate phosphatase PAH1
LINLASKNLPEDEFTILALTPEKPVLILDVDGTLTQERWNFWQKENVPYDAHTVQVVNDLATRYAIVYLTARPRPLHRRTRRWLEEKGFPLGPVLVWSPRKIRWLDIEDYKQDVLNALRQQGINLAVGIGDMEDDIEAYRKAGMKAIILGKEESGAQPAYSWQEIENLLVSEKK